MKNTAFWLQCPYALAFFQIGACAIGACAMVGSLITPTTIAAAAPFDEWSYCATVITKYEQEYDLPQKILTAISLAESGRVDANDDQLKAWPWAVMAERKGRYLPNKAAAIAEVRKLQKRGIKNIDVGCMQINLYYHPRAFASLNEAFTPDHNVAYAAQFLSDLYKQHRSWSQAVAYYHSGDQTYNYPYRQKVMTLWHQQTRTRAPTRKTTNRPKGAGMGAGWRKKSQQNHIHQKNRDLQDNSSSSQDRRQNSDDLSSVKQVQQRHKSLRSRHTAGMKHLDTMAKQADRRSKMLNRYMDTLGSQ